MKSNQPSRRAPLGSEDIGGLLASPTTEVRVMSARRLATEFARPGLSTTERNLSIDAFRHLARDPDVEVRAALADALRDEPLVPHDIVHALALDVPAVALAVLEHSIVLSDEDLTQAVRGGESAQRRAVARRAQVSPLLAEVLVDTRDEAVVHTLMRNPGAEIAESTYDAAARAFTEASPVQGALADHRFAALLRSLAQRTHMPVFLAERLIARVADKVRAAFLACDHIRPASVETLVARSRERSTVALLRHGRDDDAADLARHLARSGRLSASLVLRALLQGHVRFAHEALAEAAGVAVDDVTAAIGPRKGKAFARLAAAAGIPDTGTAALALVFAAARQKKYRGGLIGYGPFIEGVLDRSGVRDVEACVNGLGLEASRLGGALAERAPRAS